MSQAPHNQPLMSVVVPVYEVTEFLPAALDSVLAQQDVALKITVVDDGSSPVAAQRIAAACSIDPRIHLLTQPHAGQGAARRKGVQHARGSLVMFLDADDVLLPKTCARFAAAMLQHPHAIAAYGNRCWIDEQGAPCNIASPAPATTGDLLPGLLRGQSLLSNGNICIRTSALDDATFADKLYLGEDWVTWCRLALRGAFVPLGGAPVVAIRTHTQNVSRRGVTFPSPLFRMLPIVFDDACFEQAVGTEKLVAYRRQHYLVLCNHLVRAHREAGHALRARWYWLRGALLRWTFPPKQPDKIRVLHMVKWFDAGGAEQVIRNVIAHSDPAKYEHYILSLSDEGERLAQIQPQLGISYKSIALARGKRNYIGRLLCLAYMWRVKPDVVKTWLASANIAGGLLGKYLRIPVIWGIHSAQPVAEHNPYQFSYSHKLPHKVVCCSDAARDICRAVGYKDSLLHVIRNGVDTQHFARNVDAGNMLREALGIAADAPLIGMAGIFVPLKRHVYFLKAAELLHQQYPAARFLWCGKGTQRENKQVQQLLATSVVGKQVVTLGIRDDMAAIYSALTIHTQVSTSESFGLATAEAMACEAAVVTTDVGVFKPMLEGVGTLIPVDDNPQLLADAWAALLAMPTATQAARLKLGRERIIHDYSITQTAQHYDALIAQVLANSRRKRGKIGRVVDEAAAL